MKQLIVAPKELLESSVKSKVYVFDEPISMSASFDKLSTLIDTWNATSATSNSGNVFVFVNKRFTYVKILFYSKGGLCILAKRLNHGRFTLDLRKRIISIESLGEMLDATLVKISNN